ncbi:MAG: DUF5606 domain-containing protein [Bacteroidota bacterium]|nr:DUF5606 domain-containing protein [Bacteroidota bacterium]
MDLKKILTIAGKPDLFELISNTGKGIIVESIVTKKRTQAFSHQRVNSLGDIAVYSQKDELPLKDVFLMIYKKEDGGNAISHKANANEVKAYFEEFFPDYDRDRVQYSAMKRIIKWYNLLNDNKLIDDKHEEEEKDGENNDLEGKETSTKTETKNDSKEENNK